MINNMNILFDKIKKTDFFSLQTIMLLSVLNLVLYNMFYTMRTIADTVTYFRAGEIYFDGMMDPFRTPIYPVICHIAHLLSPIYQNQLVVIAQSFIFLFSIPFFFRLCRMIIVNKKLSFVCTLLYSCNPFIVCYTKAIITESIATSLFIMWLSIT